MAVPQRVVSQYVPPWAQHLQHQFVVVDIVPFVRIDKRHVERHPQLRHQLHGIPYQHRDFVGIGRSLQPRACEVLLLVVYLYGVEMPVGRQTLRYAQGRVAAIGPYLQHLLRLHHLREHLQYASLQMPRCHARIEQFQVRVPIQLVQIVALRVYVRQYILLQCHCFRASSASSARR